MRYFGLLALVLTAFPMSSAAQDVVETVARAPLAGPQYDPAFGQGAIGFYGTDLGFTMKHRGQLRIVFGDTWAAPLVPSIGPLGDDSQGIICLAPGPGCPFGGVPLPTGDAVDGYVGPQIGPFWTRSGPPLVFERNAFGLIAPLPVYDGGLFDPLLDMGPNRTPSAVFSNGRTGGASAAFALFYRGEGIECTTDASCGGGYACDLGLGRDEFDMPCVDSGASCENDASVGICIDDESPRVDPTTPHGRLRGALHRMRIGNADRGVAEIYYTKPWDTHRFLNPSATTVRSYTLGSPTVADPRPAESTNSANAKVFLWGRPSFAGTDARPANLYFAVVDIPAYDANGSFDWQPMFFDGTPAAPTFGSDEQQATALELAEVGGPNEPMNIVNQLSVRFIEELDRWVMIYGGDLHPYLYPFFTGNESGIDRNPGGAVFVRFAEEPWGPWSAPQPLLVAGDHGPTPTGEYVPGGILHNPDCSPWFACVPGEIFWDLAFPAPPNPVPGYLYGANLIPEWTEENPGANTVDIYWNVSTFAPYQVVLMRSTITKP